MGVYNRDNSLPGTIAKAAKDLEDIKQSQIIGNDNLIVKYYSASILDEPLLDDVEAVFKISFLLNDPSTSLVTVGYNFQVNPSSGFLYTYNFYADPSTVDSTTERAWFFSITGTQDADITIISSIRSTKNGVALIERVS